MQKLENNAFFWQKVDTLLFSSTLEITRKKGSQHPTYKNLIYPVDYGVLKETASSDNGIHVFKGTKKSNDHKLVVAADILNKDIEVKLLVDCSDEEVTDILHFLNQTDFQKTILIGRGMEIPAWSTTD